MGMYHKKLHRAMRAAATCAVLAMLTTFTQPLSAQQQVTTRSLSIEEALQMAGGTSEQIAVAAAGVQRAHGQQLQAKSQYFPQINATANYSRALASEFQGVFGSSTSTDTATTTSGDSTGGGGIDFSNLPFGRKNTYNFGLSLQQNLYTGGRLKAQNHIADATKRTADITLA